MSVTPEQIQEAYDKVLDLALCDGLMHAKLRQHLDVLRSAALSPPSAAVEPDEPPAIDIGDYQRRVIDLFQSGQASEAQWVEMARCVLYCAEQDPSDYYPEQIEAAVAAAKPKAPSPSVEQRITERLSGFVESLKAPSPPPAGEGV